MILYTVKCGGIFNSQFIANFPQNVTVNEFLNPSIFGEDIDKSLVACFFGLTMYIIVITAHRNNS